MAEDIVIRTKSGVPVEADFQNIVTRDGGFTRIYMVVDTDTGVPYTRLSDGTIVAVALGTGTATGTNTGDVTLAGETYLSIVGQVLTAADVNLTTHVTGTLPVGSGGTGLTAGTSGGVLYYSGAGALASSAALGSTQVVLGGGAGAAPNTSANLTFDGATLVLTGAETISGTLGVSDVVTIQKNSNAEFSGLLIKNTTAGTASKAGYQLVSDASAGVSFISKQSSTYTTSGRLVADSTLIEDQGVNGLHLSSLGAAGTVNFWVNATKRGFVDSTGINGALGGTTPNTIAGTTGVFSSTLKASSTITAGYNATGSGIMQIGPDAPSANGSGHIYFKNSSTVRNWAIRTNQNVSGAIEIIPSTAAGGTTWSSTAAVLIRENSNVMVPASLRVGSSVAPTVALDVTGAALISTTLGVTGNVTCTADLAVNGGDLTTSASTFNMLTANATTVNAFTAASTLRIGASNGKVGIGTAVSGAYGTRFANTITSDGSSTVAIGVGIEYGIVGASGDTDYLVALNLAPPSTTTQGVGDTIGRVSTARFAEPRITVGAGDTITQASTVVIVNAPTEGITNYALMVVSGLTRLDGGLNIGGDAARSTTQPTNFLSLYDGTAPVGTLTNGVTFYSTAGEARVMDAAGNATLLSPHEKGTNRWIYDSVDTRTGRSLRVQMEQMLHAINDEFGWSFIKETGAGLYVTPDNPFMLRPARRNVLAEIDRRLSALEARR